MECPRCDGPLERYALQGREAVACEGCGYIGVPVEHREEPREVESWDDAVSRFQGVDAAAVGTVESSEDVTPRWVYESDDADGTAPTANVVRIETSAKDDENVVTDGITADDARVADDGPTGGPFTCEFCDRQFDRRAQLNGHLAVHSGEKE